MLMLMPYLAVASDIRTMEFTGMKGPVTFSLQFPYEEVEGEFVMSKCTKKSCRYEIRNPHGTDEQGSFTGELNLLMAGMYDFNSKATDESREFKGVISSEYGGYSFDGEVIASGGNVEELQMSQIFDADTGEAPVVESESSDTSHAPAKEAAPAKKASNGMPLGQAIHPLTHFDSAVAGEAKLTDGSSVGLPTTVSAGVLPATAKVLTPNSESEVVTTEAPPTELDTTTIVASAAQTTDTPESQNYFAKKTVVFGISGVVCLVGLFGLVVVALRRRVDVRSTTVVTSDHWADPNFGPGDRNLVANISVL